MLPAVLRPWPPRKPAVFVNHTGSGQHVLSGVFAAELADALESGGVQAFIDYTGIDHGNVWPNTLREEAASCAVFVAVVSEPYTRRFWPMHELDIAMQRWREEQADPGGGGGGAGALRGHILPVLFEAGGDAPVRPADVEAFWRSEAALSRLTDEERGCVDAARWAANVAALKDELQSKRGGAFHHKGSLVRSGANAGRWRALCVGQGALVRRRGPCQKLSAHVLQMPKLTAAALFTDLDARHAGGAAQERRPARRGPAAGIRGPQPRRL
jgi:hypothetical protein